MKKFNPKNVKFQPTPHYRQIDKSFSTPKEKGVKINSRIPGRMDDDLWKQSAHIICDINESDFLKYCQMDDVESSATKTAAAILYMQTRFKNQKRPLGSIQCGNISFGDRAASKKEKGND